MLILNELYGRFGNNVYQLLNIINEGLKKNSKINIQILKQSLGKLLDIDKIQEEFNKNINCDKEKSEIQGNFFPRDLHLCNKRLINIMDYFKLALLYIHPYFKLDMTPLNSKVCCIHIRSYCNINDNIKHTFNSFFPPPLSYYKRIIQDLDDDYDEFIIITESNKYNPYTEKLLQYSKKIKLVKQDYINDYLLLLKSTTVVLCKSSFSDTSIFLSPNIKNVYFWNFNHCFSDYKFLPNNINFHSYIVLGDYTQVNNKLNNKNEANIINYPINKIQNERYLVIFTTCKPFLENDAWRQEQAILSWTKLTGMKIKIIILGDDYGVSDICNKYKVIHCKNIKTLEGIPYLDSMFSTVLPYVGKDDYLMWTNSDMIYYNDVIKTILEFDKLRNEKKINFRNFILSGQRHDWHNPKILDYKLELDKNKFLSKIKINERRSKIVEQQESLFNECSLHLPCGIDYIIHSKTTLINRFNKNLVIAGTRHDMILYGIGIKNNFFSCDITNTNFVIHQNHGNEEREKVNILIKNNTSCDGELHGIEKSLFKSIYDDSKNIKFVYKNK